MRIVINGLFLIPDRVGGSETYLRGLVNGLVRVDTENTYILVCGPEAAPTFRLPAERWKVLSSPVASACRACRLLLEQVWLPYVARKLDADLMHSAGYTAPLRLDIPSLVSILDMNYMRHPEDFSRPERLVYRTLIPRVARHADHIVTLSNAAKADIVYWTGVRETKVMPIPLAPRLCWPGDPSDDEVQLAAAHVSRPYVLSVAASYPHKNLARLIDAFPQAGVAGEPVQLVLVGLKGRAHPAIEARARDRQDAIKVLGWVSGSLLAALYRNALALAFPSLHEGFGLPILEAMALGTPVLTSNFGAMAEVAGEAAELVDPRDTQGIQAGLSRILKSSQHRERLREAGWLRARQFSWERTAMLTRSVYESQTNMVRR